MPLSTLLKRTKLDRFEQRFSISLIGSCNLTCHFNNNCILILTIPHSMSWVYIFIFKLLCLFSNFQYMLLHIAFSQYSLLRRVGKPYQILTSKLKPFGNFKCRENTWQPQLNIEMVHCCTTNITYCFYCNEFLT